MTDSTFVISFVPVKSGQFGLTWTSTSADVRPTFNLENVSNPAIGDEVHFFFDGVEYTETIDYEHLYLLRAPFPELPELLNDTYSAYVQWHSGSTVTTSNTVDVTINVAYSVPVVSAAPTIANSNGTFTVTPASVTGRPIPTNTYQWKRDGSSISGATGLTYTKSSPADDGVAITCTQTATNSEGSDSDTSTGIYVPVPAYFHASISTFNAGSTSPYVKTGVDFGTYSGTRTALIYFDTSYNTNTPSALLVDGVAATRIGTSSPNNSLWKINIANGGLHDVSISTTEGVMQQVVLSVGTLATSINSTPTTVVRDSNSGSGIDEITYLPGTTVVTDGVQLVWAYFCDATQRGTPPYTNALLEAYVDGTVLQYNNAHVLSSQENLRMSQKRSATYGVIRYIGAIFEPV